MPRLALAGLGLTLGLILLPSTTAAGWSKADPGDPFTMTTDKIGCRTGTVRVTLRNQTRRLARFDLRADSVNVATGSIPARKAITRHVRVRHGRGIEIAAYSVSDAHPDTLIESTRVRNDCPRGRRRHLPDTGPPVDLMGKLATAGGMVLTGGIMWWYGSVWPRRDHP
jgi:hypothetical protein